MVGVFHHIGQPSEDHMVNSLEQILGFKGQVTFDGAYRSVYEHRKVLGKRNPLLFIQGNTINTEGVCSLAEIMELMDWGFKLGWHGYTHRRLTELTDQEVRDELYCPLSEFVFDYAYPHGDFDDRTKQLVQEMGYQWAFSTTQGNDDPFSLRREYV